MKFEITGKIEKITPIVEIPTSNGGFKKREVVICEKFGDTENHVSFEFAGKHVEQPDNVKVGDTVVVAFFLQGRNYMARDGQEKNFTKAVGFDIKPLQQTEHTAPEGIGIPLQPNPTPKQAEIDNDDLPF